MEASRKVQVVLPMVLSPDVAIAMRNSELLIVDSFDYLWDASLLSPVIAGIEIANCCTQSLGLQ